MITSNRLSFIRRLLYKLKRDFGLSINLIQITSEEVNTQTGVRTMQRTVIPISRAILLPSTLARKFAYEHSYLIANRQFTYGAQYDVNQRTMIIDAADVPDNVEIRVNNYTVFEGKRYTVKMVERFEHRFGFLLTLTETEGSSTFDILPLSVSNTLRIGQYVES